MPVQCQQRCPSCLHSQQNTLKKSFELVIVLWITSMRPFCSLQRFRGRVFFCSCPIGSPEQQKKVANKPHYVVRHWAWALLYTSLRFAPSREEHSMDQHRSRLKLSENFERHWSILDLGDIHMDQSLVHAFSWGEICMDQWSWKFFYIFPLHWHWPMDGSSQPREPCDIPDHAIRDVVWVIWIWHPGGQLWGPPCIGKDVRPPCRRRRFASMREARHCTVEPCCSQTFSLFSLRNAPHICHYRGQYAIKALKMREECQKIRHTNWKHDVQTPLLCHLNRFHFGCGLSLSSWKKSSLWLRGPAAILFTLRDACSDSSAKLFASVKPCAKGGGYRTIWGNLGVPFSLSTRKTISAGKILCNWGSPI